MVIYRQTCTPFYLIYFVVIIHHRQQCAASTYYLCLTKYSTASLAITIYTADINLRSFSTPKKKKPVKYILVLRFFVFARAKICTISITQLKNTSIRTLAISRTIPNQNNSNTKTNQSEHI